MRKSWRTTLAGLLGALGAALTATPEPITHFIGVGLTIVAPVILGAVARDQKVTSEQAGAK